MKRLERMVIGLMESTTALTMLSTLTAAASINSFTTLLAVPNGWGAISVLLVFVGGIAWAASGYCWLSAENGVRDHRSERDGVKFKELTQRPARSVRSAIVLLTGSILCLLLAVWLGSKPQSSDISARSIDSAQSSELVRSVSIGYQQTGMYSHIFCAEQERFFEQEGVSVELIPFVSANQMMESLLAGRLDVAGLTNLEVAIKVESKEPGKFEMINALVWEKDAFPDYLLVRRSCGVTDVSGLAGKKIGLHPGSAVRAFATVVLANSGVDASSCQLIELPPTAMTAAIVAGSVDALYCMDPVATSLVERNEVDVLLRNPLGAVIAPPIPISGTAISSQLLKDSPEVVKALRRAIDRGIAFAQNPEHVESVAKHVSLYTAIPVSDVKKMNPSVYWSLESIQHSVFQRVIDRFVEIGIAERRVQARDVLLSTDPSVPVEF